MATWKNLLLQDSASPLMEQLMFFHDHTLMILVIITILVGHMLISMFFNKFTHRFLLDGQMIEMIWTILPAIILIMIALPSLRLLYILDENFNPMISIKTIGHQWYWSYEYSDYKNLEFDSYMIPSNELNKSNFRVLDVDNRMIIPFNCQIRMIVTSADVIHSWTIPSLGVKIDGTPGRLNQTNFNTNRTGLFFGQCSEICGANHSFMPIVIESISPKFFLKWIKNN
uniref:Cytochrome c oxidase subunit 2 n=1 Tax=Anthonomus eugenii TaxID=122869 RepID=A0A5B8ZV86_9CUCU|nr:cytochrome c oxidase subunit II [Anthonomus eugenii]QED56827.1 cytochrome oxidase subunit II [Anthonomus eugenii]QED56828.1 cytochrome oxidase subunit II [Anthonomus eugenii]QED56829.1 cytochrome oxidase subunit II [Anthonomus eugenii]QED56830.1 cytochrome oxidase subunit II [Anthonomus eugenii]QED56831.1 cytochrome oxidase subunit II [Anthonomus eugenii]